jgi:hypothetical protein
MRQGTSRRRVRSIAAYLIHIVRLMELTSLRDVESHEIGKAAECWSSYRGPDRRRKAGKTAASCFSGIARKWFRFHGRLTTSRVSENPCSELVRDFTEYMRSTRGPRSRVRLDPRCNGLPGSLVLGHWRHGRLECWLSQLKVGSVRLLASRGSLEWPKLIFRVPQLLRSIRRFEMIDCFRAGKPEVRKNCTR